MKRTAIFTACLLGAVATAGLPPQAPPPAFRAERPWDPSTTSTRAVRPHGGATLHSIGDPTDAEQLYLELINEVRADPLGGALALTNTTDPDILSAYQFFSVDLAKFVADTRNFPVAQPLAFEPRLIQAARGHSLWMLTQGIQAHNETDPANPGTVITTSDRITAVGYPWRTLGENVYAFSKSVAFGHAGFEVDWGIGPGGMQDPPGHRISNHSTAFREVGIGVVEGNGPNGTGPSSVTVDFAAPQIETPLVTGVAYYDLNSNARYDLGEGIGNIRVDVSGSDSYALTSASGGYAVPSGDGERTVQFSAEGLSTVSLTRKISGGLNTKADLRLTYPAPVAIGPGRGAVGKPLTYSHATVPGAAEFRARLVLILTKPTSLDGSRGLEDFTADLGGTPEPLVNRPGGGKAYHLTQTNGVTPNWMQATGTYRPKATGTLRWLSRLGWASSNQVARVQLTADGGTTWTNLWSKTGTGTAGDGTYTQQSVSLSPFAGRTVQFRFWYGIIFCTTNCAIFNQPDNSVGYHFDSVEFLDTEQLKPQSESVVPAGSPVVLTPTLTGSHEVSLQAISPRADWPWGSALPVDIVSSITPPTVALGTGTPPAGGWVAPAIVPLTAVVNAQGNTLTKVQFLADGKVVGEDATSPYSLDWNVTTAGSRSVVARVVFGLNQTVDSAAAIVAVSSSSPTVILTVGTPPGGGWVAPASVPLEAAVDAHGHAITKVQFLADGTLVGEDSEAPYSITWTGVAAGMRSVVARVLYGSALSVDSALKTVLVSAPAPTVTLTVGTAPEGGWIAPASVPLEAAVDTHGQPITKVQFLADGRVVGEDSEAPYSVVWSDAAVGARSVIARALYGEGLSADSAATSVTIGEPPAVVDITGVAAAADGSIEVRFTVTGNPSGLPRLRAAPVLEGPFVETAALLQTNSPSAFTFRVQPSGAVGFLKVLIP
ncbi:MAG: Ig-like domain-containing protein [Verrucomicrobiota bacterium]